MLYSKNVLSKVFYFGIVFMMLSSCSSNVSRSTGWKINSKDSGGFFANLNFDEQDTGNGLIFIEGGSFLMGNLSDDVMKDYNTRRIKQHVSSFYMDETEVTNIMYREYLHWIKRVFPSTEELYRNIYTSVVPDSLVWRDRLSYNEVYVDNYFRHPAYNDYPVVGVSWVQANKFCKWRTDRVNENILIKKGILKNVHGSEDKIIEGANHFDTDVYLANPDNVFEDKSSSVYNEGLPSYSIETEDKGEFQGRHVNREDGILLPNYRLPSEIEWEYAAIGYKKTRNFNNLRSRRVLPWKDGKILANYKNRKGDYSGIAGWSNDGADITAKVKSYPPNDFGLYDMAGNVSEWVSDIYRPDIDFSFSDFRYYRGNVFKKNKLDEEGLPMLVTEENIRYDTLSNGKIIPKELPGELTYQDITAEDTYMRNNYSAADNRDYGDGDKKSSKNYKNVNSKNKMYNSPKNKIKLGKDGKLKGVYDAKYRTTLVNNKSRVYKGGSWNDRIYWLQPAQRRFLDQDLSSAFIGFRCAMDRLGDISKEGKRVID